MWLHLRAEISQNKFKIDKQENDTHFVAQPPAKLSLTEQNGSNLTFDLSFDVADPNPGKHVSRSCCLKNCIPAESTRQSLPQLHTPTARVSTHANQLSSHNDSKEQLKFNVSGDVCHTGLVVASDCHFHCTHHLPHP